MNVTNSNQNVAFGNRVRLAKNLSCFLNVENLRAPALQEGWQKAAETIRSKKGTADVVLSFRSEEHKSFVFESIEVTVRAAKNLIQAEVLKVERLATMKAEEIAAKIVETFDHLNGSLRNSVNCGGESVNLTRSLRKKFKVDDPKSPALLQGVQKAVEMIKAENELTTVEMNASKRIFWRSRKVSDAIGISVKTGVKGRFGNVKIEKYVSIEGLKAMNNSDEIAAKLVRMYKKAQEQLKDKIQQMK